MNDKNLIRPEIGQTCPALTKEDYSYHLSGDAAKNCQCILNGKLCVGVEFHDIENQTSQFFSRARCFINTEEIKSCIMCGMSKETFISIVKEKSEKELEEKLKSIEK